MFQYQSYQRVRINWLSDIAGHARFKTLRLIFREGISGLADDRQVGRNFQYPLGCLKSV